MYYPVLIIVMAIAGLYFTVLTRGVQIRLFPESIRLLKELPEDKKNVSSLQAMLVSTASRVGMVLFAFTTLIGNLYYVDNALIYLNKKRQPSKLFMRVFHILCALVILIGAMIPMGAAWAMADITMGGMTLINLPCCMLLGKVAIDALKDYEAKKKAGEDPVFHGRDIGLSEDELDFWK